MGGCADTFNLKNAKWRQKDKNYMSFLTLKTLRSIKSDNDRMVNAETSIKAAAVSKFQNILGQIRSCNVNSNFQFERVLTEDQQLGLIRQVTADEIEKVVLSFNPTKAPVRTDSMPN